MGRSSYCLKIITCSSDSAAKDDDDLLQAPENKSSSDKRGWSFWKRSGRHRVLSNTFIAEVPYSANKESSESANIDFQSPDVPEKISAIHCTDEKPQWLLSDPKVSEIIAVTRDGNDVHAQLDESAVIVIQTAVREFLAQKELFKLKVLVKLQAAVRGHLVRQQAIGTLRCVQAIVKIQALFRANRTCLLQEGSTSENMIDGKQEKAISTTTVEECSLTKQNVSYNSFAKLISNRFVCKLMESTPKKRSIRIKCDPSKPNYTWSWLEWWMSVSSAEPTAQPELKNEQLGTERNAYPVSLLETGLPPEGSCQLEDSMSNSDETVLPSETKKNPLTYGADNFKFQARLPDSSLVGDDLEQSQSDKISKSDAKEASENVNSISTRLMQSDVNSQTQVKLEPSFDSNSLSSHTMQSDLISQLQMNALPHKAETEGEQNDQAELSMQSYASEQIKTEGKKFVYGSRRASNPAFIAAYSKFEECSVTDSNRSLSSSYQDSGVDLQMDTVSSTEDTVTKTKELRMVEDSIPNNLRAHDGDSECGIELSASLHSPDRSEPEAVGNEHKVKSSGRETSSSDVIKDGDVKSKFESTESLLNLSEYVAMQAEKLKLESIRGVSVDSVVVADSPNPEASPASHVTVLESRGTPSGQLSMEENKNKTDKSASNRKRKSLSAGQISPSNSSRDSGARSSMEQLRKDQKDGKRPNSFGLTRPEQTDQEPRDSSSNGSLPRFMQNTESARAKIQANNSQGSSPDAQDRDYIRKRHSLPGANGKQCSPSIQQSLSKAQPGTKENGSHVIHEKKWQR